MKNSITLLIGLLLDIIDVLIWDNSPEYRRFVLAQQRLGYFRVGQFWYFAKKG